MVKIPSLDVKEVGEVKEVKHGVMKVSGLPSCVYGQLIEFTKGFKGMVIGFTPKEVLAIGLAGEGAVSVGDPVSSAAELINIPVGENFLGRIVDSLGAPLDGKGEVIPSDFFPIFRDAPGILEREPINEPLLTGVKIIDLVIPIGKGQRELIIGDRQIGKTSIALDTIINQKDKGVVCIYCFIGGPGAGLKKQLQVLRQNKALGHTIVVASSADTSAAEQYLVPYTAASLGEYFMYGGRDVLVVFDDLTKHAWIYRQMSLLLERSPGREAYPGDIFYIHSQFMERAGRLKKEKGGGSMTFLPIVETRQGDITGYIQTNLISMTDGQIYLSTNLFHEGFKPAIDIGLSVSRIGSKVQYPAIKEVSRELRLEYTQYRNMLRLTKLRARLSKEAIEKLRRGEALERILVQANQAPLSAEEEIILFYTFKRRILEAISGEMLKKFMENFFGYLKENNPSFLGRLKERKDLTPEIKEQLDKIIVEFFRSIKKNRDSHE